MSAKWKWNTINIYVSDEDAVRPIKRAEIYRLDAVDTSYHFFGAASRKISIKGMIIGIADRNALLSDAINDVARTFTTPWETISNAKINGEPKFTTIQYAGGVLDGVAYSAATTALYTVELEIIL